MKYIKLINEEWQSAFGEIDRGSSEKNEDFLYRKFRKILKDADPKTSIQEIKVMFRNGEMNILKDAIGEDKLYKSVFDFGRTDIADILYDNGYYINDLESVNSWLKHSRGGEDMRYAARNYVR